MIRKWVSGDSPIEYARRIRVLLNWTKIKHPKVLPVAMRQELLRVLPTIAIQTFYAISWIAHYYYLVGHIY